MVWYDECHIIRLYAMIWDSSAKVWYSIAMLWDSNVMVWDSNVMVWYSNAMLWDIDAMLCYGVCCKRYDWTDCICICLTEWILLDVF